jgi:hypothetical protein
MTSHVLALPFAFTLVGLAACSNASGNATPPAPLMAPDVSSFQATWKADTIVLDEATVKAWLRNPTATDGIYQFDPSLSRVAAMKPGQALVLTGVDLVKVNAVVVQPDAIVVTTERASLLDAATDADVSWDIGADMSKGPASEPQSFAPRLTLQSAPTTTDCDPASDAGPCTSKLSFSGKLGNLDASQTFSFGQDGSAKLVAKLSYRDPKSTNLQLDTAVTATVKSFRHQGNIVIRGGAVQTASVSVPDVDADLTLQLNANTLGTSDDTFKLPISFTFRFPMGPIPAYFTMSGAVRLSPSLAATSLVKANLQHHVGGGFGLTFDGATLGGSGSLDSASGADPKVSDAAAVCDVTAGMGLLTEFPKVAFGVGIAPLASAEVYLVGKEELVVNDVLKYDAHGFIVGNCLTVQGNTGAYVGGSLRLAALGFKQEKEIYGHQRQVFKGGNPSTAAACK